MEGEFVIELIDLSQWKKQKEIIVGLHREYGINISARMWRNEVNKWNKRWACGDVPYCITHSPRDGFKATDDFEEACIAIKDYRARIGQMFKREKEILEGFKIKNNYQIDIESGEIK